ncbi:MAG: bifunctional UDP-N-acetylmuramoyl-tripeptide:D-alanyl-D-alanine ligase/alanine racemase [Bacteroidetes bacterium]|nr:bifunctional UDP-N-acetylmuramoyl-tripeptide:D-alanyl-D-alanine ligase/alanine racemase [Bacteroidota bacterium]
MKFSLREIEKITGGRIICKNTTESVVHIYFDTRRLVYVNNALFIAIVGPTNDGHKYILDAWEKGIRIFILEDLTRFEELDKKICNSSSLVLVENSVEALQKLAIAHRDKFHVEVVAITGSNGKTIVKEWLYHILYRHLNVYRSPKSFNSQIGVSLSVLGIRKENQLCILEAGISRVGEMKKLEPMIKADVGIFTNLGSAHDEGFTNRDEKIAEKLEVFKNCKTLIYCQDHALLHKMIQQKIDEGYFTRDINLIKWSRNQEADLRVHSINKINGRTKIDLVYRADTFTIDLPFNDHASIENAIHCCVFLLFKNYSIQLIQNEIKQLAPIEMRLELKEGLNNCTLINDTYNSDLNSLEIALDYLNQQKQHPEKVLILSDVLQSGKNSADLYADINKLLIAKKIDYLIGIGPEISQHKELFEQKSVFYPSTSSFLNNLKTEEIRNQSILIKGARTFEFEKITHILQKKVHQTCLEVNLSNIIFNLNVYRSYLKPETRIMVMVKAFSYGSGSFEIANILQYHQVDYLAVAYADEGVELRRSGIELPILVMNPEGQSFDQIISHRLEPEIYSMKSLHDLITSCKLMKIPEVIKIHIKVDTGMHRLGFTMDDLPELLKLLAENSFLKVTSVFSHLASADDLAEVDFTKQQIEKFNQMCNYLSKKLTEPFLKHLLNSAGVVHFPEAQFDMVRLGIGLYGIDFSRKMDKQLLNVSTFKTTISQIKKISRSDTVGYNRQGKLNKEATIATIGVGYADGFPRLLGNGKGVVKVKEKLVHTVGNICMDMCMIDITGLDAEVGEEVILFDEELSVTQMAENCQTIPYEILAGISQRVKRVYFNE